MGAGFFARLLLRTAGRFLAGVGLVAWGFKLNVPRLLSVFMMWPSRLARYWKASLYRISAVDKRMSSRRACALSAKMRA